MSSDEKLRVNTLHRFAKHSDRLVLMEYSHCEVPAGCGGYIMRWHDPRAGVPLVFNVACPAEIEAFIDGAPLTAGRLTLPPGGHLLAVHATLERTPAPLVVGVYVDYPQSHLGEGAEVVLFSAGDGSWRHNTSAPPDGSWIEASFDDARWPALRAWTPTQEELGRDHWRYEGLIRRGAEALRLESREVWIRKPITTPEGSTTR
jgi:hypothetical protein